MDISYLWMQNVDAVVGHEENLDGPQSHERPGVHLPHLVSTQIQQPAAVGDILRDLVQPTSPAVHQVRLVAQTGAGAQPEARHDTQERNQAKHHATTGEHRSGVKEHPVPLKGMANRAHPQSDATECAANIRAHGGKKK